nr:putative reverse transcriptase domain-containing protein [Tanacetum cinerariifolium]
MMVTMETVGEMETKWQGNGDENGRGNGNGNGRGNGNGNPNRNNRGAMLVALECTCHDFIKCQPLNFKGTERVIGLTRWFEKIKTVFRISNCPERLDNNPRDNRGQQPLVKRQNVGGQNVARAYTAGNNERMGYAGFPYYNKYKLHHEEQ